MTKFGYARVSSNSQSLDIQIADLNKHVCEHIRSEKVSGKNIEERPELNIILQFMRTGDELVVTRIDRLARSIIDLRNIIDLLNKKGCTLRATQQPIDTSTSIGRMMIGFLGLFAEFELEIRKERQRAGIDAWMDKVRRGEVETQKRTPKFDPAEIRRLHHHNMKPRAIAKKLGCSNQTIYRVLELGANNPVKSNSFDFTGDAIPSPVTSPRSEKSP